MSLNETGSKSIISESRLAVLSYDEKDKSFVVKSSSTGHVLKISDTFAEIYHHNVN